MLEGTVVGSDGIAGTKLQERSFKSYIYIYIYTEEVKALTAA